MNTLTVTCPITQERIADPVSTPGGHTYEGAAIRRWVAEHGTSPQTRNSLRLAQLSTNYALRDVLNGDLNSPSSDSPLDNDNKMEEEEWEEVEAPYVPVDVVYSKVGHNLVQVRAPDTDGAPIEAVLTIDTSYSMDDDVSVQDADGNSEQHGLTILDLTKHAAKTIVKALRPCDKMAIVVYSTEATVKMPMTKVTQSSVTRFITAIESIEANGSTNLWDGILKGLEQFKGEDRDPTTHKSLMVLTDGRPNINPPRGEYDTLRRYYDSNYDEVSDVVIDTFGFGYSLDSGLLQSISEFTHGAYSFIPDAGMLGTVFVNAIANTLNTVARNVTVEVSTSIDSSYGAGDVSQVNIGTLRAGQHVTVPITGENAQVTCAYDNFIDSKKIATLDSDPPVDVDTMRFDILHLIKSVLPLASYLYSSEHVPSIKNYIQSLKDSGYNGPLLKDLEEQILLALSSGDNYRRWGCHYIPSLLSAHRQSRCNNFKDGVVAYGGDTFKALREKIEKMFIEMPPPTPSGHHSNYGAPVSMSRYYNADGGCVAHGSMIHMFNGDTVPIQNIKKGDKLFSPEDPTTPSIVRSLVVTQGYTGILTAIGELNITDWHPVRIEGEWVFPGQHTDVRTTYQDDVYNLVLENNHTYVADHVECVSLGHSFKGDVISHDYYGSQKVIDDLSKLEGWNDGVVFMRKESMKRDPTTQLVIGIE